MAKNELFLIILITVIPNHQPHRSVWMSKRIDLYCKTIWSINYCGIATLTHVMNCDEPDEPYKNKNRKKRTELLEHWNLIWHDMTSTHWSRGRTQDFANGVLTHACKTDPHTNTTNACMNMCTCMYMKTHARTCSKSMPCRLICSSILRPGRNRSDPWLCWMSFVSNTFGQA